MVFAISIASTDVDGRTADVDDHTLGEGLGNLTAFGSCHAIMHLMKVEMGKYQMQLTIYARQRYLRRANCLRFLHLSFQITHLSQEHVPILPVLDNVSTSAPTQVIPIETNYFIANGQLSPKFNNGRTAQHLPDSGSLG